jgi:formate dehydrogenase major subunit
MLSQDPSGLGVYQNWAWSWPAERRVLYNRASCDPAGKPWDADRKQVWWSDSSQLWVGNDVPDFKADSNPKDHMGPFIMNAEGVGRIFGPLAAFADGPFPEHYEPFESPVQNPLHPKQSNNPVVKKLNSPFDKFGTTSEGFNVICTTYRLTEHYHYWTKNNPVNVELIPEAFVEIPVELAKEVGIEGGEKVKLTSARSFYIAKAFVTSASSRWSLTASESSRSVCRFIRVIAEFRKTAQGMPGPSRTGSRQRLWIRMHSRRNSKAFW